MAHGIFGSGCCREDESCDSRHTPVEQVIVAALVVATATSAQAGLSPEELKSILDNVIDAITPTTSQRLSPSSNKRGPDVVDQSGAKRNLTDPTVVYRMPGAIVQSCQQRSTEVN